MYKLGDIVYFEHLYFKDGFKDNKKNRPCVVLASYEKGENSYIFCMPLTSKISAFNEKPYNYMVISNIIYNYKKLSFVKLDNLFEINEVHAYDTGMSLCEENIKSLKDRILSYNNRNKLYQLLKKVIKHQDLIDEKEEKERKKQKRLEKTLKRREAKRKNVQNT